MRRESGTGRSALSVQIYHQVEDILRPVRYDPVHPEGKEPFGVVRIINCPRNNAEASQGLVKKQGKAADLSMIRLEYAGT